MNTPHSYGNVLATLGDVAEFLEGYSDVVDGDDGAPAPNRAMSLLTDVERQIEELERASKKPDQAIALLRECLDYSACGSQGPFKTKVREFLAKNAAPQVSPLATQCRESRSEPAGAAPSPSATSPLSTGGEHG